MNKLLSVIVWLLPAVAVFAPASVRAHCDTLDGPVVMAARQALDTGDVKLVLMWVQKQDEAAITQAFGKTLAVRKLNPEAKDLADTYFFETLVRVHRAGEGAPYTGLKPAGSDLGPAIPAADTALKEGSVEPLLKLLTQAVEHGVRAHFEAANARKAFDKTDVEAGRKYVQAYVPFLHYVERIYEATRPMAHGHAGHAGAGVE